jgi:predicted DNA-binding antitoxin AbrB/MazE fold protein
MREITAGMEREALSLMSLGKKLDAIYENGVLRPLESLGLPEGQRVTIVVYPDWLDIECVEQCVASCVAWADESVSVEAVQEALKKIPDSLTADFGAEREDS